MCDLVRNFVALLVGLVLALGVGHLPEDGLALVAGHGHAHRHLRVPGSLDGDLVTHLRPGSRRHLAECHRAQRRPLLWPAIVTCLVSTSQTGSGRCTADTAE